MPALDGNDHDEDTKDQSAAKGEGMWDVGKMMSRK